MYDLQCLTCGVSFRHRLQERKFCSRACYYVANASKPKNERTCQRCSSVFIPPYSNKLAKFCSYSCFSLKRRGEQGKTVSNTCENCQQGFEVSYIRRSQRFCSYSCSKSGKFHHFYGKVGPTKGVKPWTTGLTKDTDERLAKAGKKISDIQKQQFLSGKRNNHGENNPNWKPPEKRRSVLRVAISMTAAYRKWRTEIFTRDQFQCVMCKVIKGPFNADHIVPFSEIVTKHNIQTIEDALACSEMWDLSNGRTLCLECHRKTPTYGNGKRKAAIS